MSKYRIDEYRSKPISASEFAAMKSVGIDVSEEDAIRFNCNFLIHMLFEPSDNESFEDLVYVPSKHIVDKLEKRFGSFDGINWGDLSCHEVNKNADGSFEVVVEEVNPGADGLKNYLEHYLSKVLGWSVCVKLEW